MHKVFIRPQWTITRPGSAPDGDALSPRLLTLLVHVAGHGSLSAACRATGQSYRHAWDTIRHGEAWFGAPLLRMERGRGSTLTPLAEKLVWADRRIAARLAPSLDSLASELEVELQRTRGGPAVGSMRSSAIRLSRHTAAKSAVPFCTSGSRTIQRANASARN